VKPISTVHAGEYLVGSHIEKTYKEARVWLPSKDTGVDLLITNQHLTQFVSLQVKFSKDFLGDQGSKSSTIFPKIKAGGWWTFNYEKIKHSSAELWVLVLYRFSHRDFDFVIIKPSELLKRYEQLGRTSKSIQSYVWVTESGECWETRGLRKKAQESIANGTFESPERDLGQFLNNWQPLEEKIHT